MKYLVGLIVIALLIGGGVMMQRQNINQMMEEETMVMDDEVVVVKMTGDDFRFDPDITEVRKGQKVKVVLTSIDMPHDFDLDEFNVDGQIAKAGETTEVEFVASDTGEFEYYCSVGNHRELGMVGKLIVI